MAMVDALLPEFDHEMTTTRKLLERVPDDRLDWKPHAKSFSLGPAGARTSRRFRCGAAMTLTQIGARPRRQSSSRRPRSRRAELLATFDGNVADARAALAGKTDAELMAPWALKRGGQTIFSMPKASGAAIVRHEPPRSSPRRS